MKKTVKKSSKKEDLGDEGMSLDDAFGGDEDVEYGKPKEKKIKKPKKGLDDEELEESLEEAEEGAGARSKIDSDEHIINASKPIAKVKKGDKIKIDGKDYEVDMHYVLIDHGSTKEMAIEIFDSKTDKDYQIRYFSDQVETTLELYELQEIMYLKRAFRKIEW